MTEAQIHAQLVQKFPGAIGPLQAVGEDDQQIRVAPQNVHAICEYLLRTRELHFDFLRHITLLPGTDRITAIYHLFSFEHGHAISIRVDVPKNQTHFMTVMDLWPAADELEDEVHSRLGIDFDTSQAQTPA